MKHFKILRYFLLAAIVRVAAQSAIAQLDLSALGTNYVESFDRIVSGLPVGWAVRTNASQTSLGSDAAFNTASVTWSSSSGQFANYASTVSNSGTNFSGIESSTVQGICTNRALGIRQTSSFGNPGAALVLRLSNTLGLANFQLGLDFLMLSVQGYSTVWTLDYAVGNNPTNFTPKATYNDPGVFGAAHTIVSFGSALDNQSENVWIRVAAMSASTGSGSRDTFAIDNVALSWATNAALVTNRPSVTTPPESRTNNAGSPASFSVEADGTMPLTYQWRKDGIAFTNDDNISGADAATVNFSSVFKADEAGYSVVISNRAGSITSSIARLTVIDPAILTQPTSRTNVAGDTANFSVAASGTASIGYQWFHNGVQISGALTDTLKVTNVAAADQGAYYVMASNAAGTAISSTAVFSLVPTPTNRIARWDFNDTSAAPTTPMPSHGSGTALLAGNTTAAFSTGTPSDPVSTNSGWNTSGYPAQGAGNLQAGVEFRVSTLGFQNILLTWEQRNTSRASRFARLQYSTDGVHFSNHNVIVMGATNSSFIFYSENLSAVPAINNNPDFAFRIVTEVENSATGSGSTNYVPTSGGTYSTAGTIRYDLVNVYGNATAAPPSVPATPLTIQLKGTNTVLTWTNAAQALQSADAVSGTFTNIPGAASPYTNPISRKRQFFRLNY